MPSNFLKRKAKEVIAPTAAEEQPSETAPVMEETAAPSYTQSGFDVFTPDGGATYQVAELAYNPETRQAVVTNIFDISRLVGMSYGNHKASLNTLKKGKK